MPEKHYCASPDILCDFDGETEVDELHVAAVVEHDVLDLWGWTDGRMNGRKDAWKGGRMHGWMFCGRRRSVIAEP